MNAATETLCQLLKADEDRAIESVMSAIEAIAEGGPLEKAAETLSALLRADRNGELENVMRAVERVGEEAA